MARDAKPAAVNDVPTTRSCYAGNRRPVNSSSFHPVWRLAICLAPYVIYSCSSTSVYPAIFGRWWTPSRCLLPAVPYASIWRLDGTNINTRVVMFDVEIIIWYGPSVTNGCVSSLECYGLDYLISALGGWRARVRICKCLLSSCLARAAFLQP